MRERETKRPTSPLTHAETGMDHRGRRRGRLLVLGIVPGLFLAAYATAARLGPLPVPEGWPPESDLAEYSGVLHVHSMYSHDGRGTI